MSEIESNPEKRIALFQRKEVRRAIHNNEWKKRGVKEQHEYAILTAEISKVAFGLTPSFSASSPTGTNTNSRGCNPRNVHADSIPTLKGSNLQLLVRATMRPLQGLDSFHTVTPGFTRCYSRCSPSGYEQAGNARRELEKKSGRKVVTSGNYLGLTQARKKRLGKK